MPPVPQNAFVGDTARFYDAASTSMFDPAVIGPTVDFLADLARPPVPPGEGSALELAVGTGRVAIPLSQRGVRVHGIDISQDMLAQLRAKPGAEHIGLTAGDIATTKVDGVFDLVYLVYNTISNLLTQEEQVDCFRNAAAHLRPGGCFVIELQVPDLQRLPVGETVLPFDVTPTHLGFDEYDILTQRLTSHHYWVAGDRLTTFDSHHRYIWTSELDLMAQIAGLTLHERWADWRRTPVTSRSKSHISVWTKTA
jgi:SAM-dependent methyltransferase